VNAVEENLSRDVVKLKKLPKSEIFQIRGENQLFATNLINNKSNLKRNE
jgi:hypothetical protein